MKKRQPGKGIQVTDLDKEMFSKPSHGAHVSRDPRCREESTMWKLARNTPQAKRTASIKAQRSQSSRHSLETSRRPRWLKYNEASGHGWGMGHFV